MYYDDEHDQLVTWDRRALDIVARQGLALIAVPCADCHRMREPHTMVRSRGSGEWHCTDYTDECHRTIVANHLPRAG